MNQSNKEQGLSIKVCLNKPSKQFDLNLSVVNPCASACIRGSNESRGILR
jgi:hypothetical protein